eukprot:Amastigsp_a843913_58.p4 type:complete len:116 gc:universal Amastigsp_a843913_58:375-722(+)
MVGQTLDSAECDGARRSTMPTTSPWLGDGRNTRETRESCMSPVLSVVSYETVSLSGARYVTNGVSTLGCSVIARASSKGKAIEPTNNRGAMESDMWTMHSPESTRRSPRCASHRP